MATISELRKKINKIDESIIKKLSARKKFAIKIGKIKEKLKIKVTDNKREKELMQFYKKLSNEHELQPEFIKKLFKMIIANSRKLQK